MVTFDDLWQALTPKIKNKTSILTSRGFLKCITCMGYFIFVILPLTTSGGLLRPLTASYPKNQNESSILTSRGFWKCIIRMGYLNIDILLLLTFDEKNVKAIFKYKLHWAEMPQNQKSAWRGLCVFVIVWPSLTISLSRKSTFLKIIPIQKLILFRFAKQKKS